MAFHFPRNPRKSIYGEKYTKDHYLSFVFFATCSPSFVISATMPTSHPTDALLAALQEVMDLIAALPKEVVALSTMTEGMDNPDMHKYVEKMD
jgi:hypothetical protein